MLRLVLFLTVACFGLDALAAEKVFDFNQFAIDAAPEGFRSALTGPGRLGDWRVTLDRVPAALTAPLPPGQKREISDQRVLGQFAQQRTDDHFPLFIYDGEVFDDFVLRTQFKLVAGRDEQMAGIAFRIRDEKNYYYIRASALGGTFAFFRVMNGQLGSPVTANLRFETNVWYDLLIECKANEIRASLNGEELLLIIVRDQPIDIGKIGFWTKSDSVSFFARTMITYTPKETLAQKLIKDALDRYPRVRQLKIFANPEGKSEPCVIAGNNPTDIGIPAQAVEKDVIARSTIYYGKENDSVLVTFPLHDANGDTVGAVKVVMKSFPGQTEKNAIARALPIVKQMESRVRKASDLWN